MWPGQFVRVTLLLETQANALVVPVEAVNTGPKGNYVFVVKEDMTVEVRPVKQSRVVGKSAVIEGNLSAGEVVVTDGQVNLRPGFKVSIKDSLVPAGAPTTGKQGGEAK